MVFFLGAADAGEGPVSIPPGTEVGDTILVAGFGLTSFTMTDPRMEVVYEFPDGRVGIYQWVFDGDMSPITYTAVGSTNRRGALASAWRSRGATGVSVSYDITSPPSSTLTPSIDRAKQVALVGVLSSGLVDGLINPGGYTTQASSAVSNKTDIRFASWEAATRQDSPITTTTFGGDVNGWYLAAIRMNPLPFIAPPCRLTKRGDFLDFGGGRVAPTHRTQQSGFRPSGSY